MTGARVRASYDASSFFCFLFLSHRPTSSLSCLTNSTSLSLEGTIGGLCSSLARRSSAARAAEGDVKGTPWLTHLLKSKSQLDRNPSEEAWHENVSVDPRDASGKSQKLNGLTVHRLDCGSNAKQHTPYWSTVNCETHACTLRHRSGRVSNWSNLVDRSAEIPVNSRSKLQNAKCGSTIAASNASRLASNVSRVTSMITEKCHATSPRGSHCTRRRGAIWRVERVWAYDVERTRSR